MNYQVQYSVYKPEDLISHLDTVTDTFDEVTKFYTTFSFSNIVKQNLDKGNSAYVFKTAIKEDSTRTKITAALNKLHQQSLNKVLIMIREITFQTKDELNELVNQCIQKIKRDSEQIRPLVAALCWDLLSTYFMTETGEKIYFRTLLLTAVKNDYVENSNYSDEFWTKEKGEKSMDLIATLFNQKIIDDKVMASIIKDFKNKIEYKENETLENHEKEKCYKNVEHSIHQLFRLVSRIIKNENVTNVYNGLDTFLETQMVIYEENKCVSRKIRLVCKNIIEELRK